jgi:taurine dioxygenase
VLSNTGAEHQHSSGVDEQRWHSDATFLPAPPAASILRAIDVPPYGRDTLWADMVAAYEALSEPMKRMLEGLRARHDWAKPFAPYFTPGARIDQEGTVKKAVGPPEAQRQAYPVVDHPLVRTHPVSGCKALYVNPNFTVDVVGMRPDESRALLDFLYVQVQIVSFQVRLRWAPGTIAMWDNRSTQHAVALDYPYPRVMHRLTIKGTPPV